jgi:hypothetical protein
MLAQQSGNPEPVVALFGRNPQVLACDLKKPPADRFFNACWKGRSLCRIGFQIVQLLSVATKIPDELISRLPHG